MNVFNLMLSALLLLFVIMSCTWLLARYCNRATIIDLSWTFTLGLMPIFYVLLGDFKWEVQTLVCVLIPLLWSMRLGCHILKRIVKEGEDERYQELRNRSGGQVGLSMFYIYQFQGFTVWILSIAYLVILNGAPELHSWPLVFGVMIAMISIAGEALADRQLRLFKEKNVSSGGVCHTGLWKYSRHPNYFFEWLYWFSFPVMALGLSYALLTWLNPIVMYFFLTRLSGIPIAERHSVQKRGQAYIEYQRVTSGFIPWFPKR